MTSTSLLRPLEEGVPQCLFTDRMSVAKLIKEVLQQIGCAKIRHTSFSVSEEFVRAVKHLKDSGLISSYEVLLGMERARKAKLLLPFLAKVADSVRLANCHAKVILFQSVFGGKFVTVITSQNMTYGSNFEASLVIQGRSVWEEFSKRLDEIKMNHSVGLNGI